MKSDKIFGINGILYPFINIGAMRPEVPPIPEPPKSDFDISQFEEILTRSLKKQRSLK